MINIIEWIGTGLFTMLGIGSIASGGIIFSLFLIFLAALVSPKRKELIDKLPEKFRKKGIIALIGIILFVVGGLTLPGDRENSDNNKVSVSTTVTEAEEVIEETVTEDSATETVKADESSSQTDITDDNLSTENVAKENGTTTEKRTEAVAENNNETITTTQATTETQQASQTTVTEEPQTTQTQSTEALSTTQAQTMEVEQTTQAPTTESPQTTQASSSNNNGGGDLNGYPATQPLEGRIVYITNTGQKYHESGCRMLKNSKIEISLTEAESRGYAPCGICH